MTGKKITIAIDGYVATGKGTTAQGIARELGYLYLDTGAMYRAVTLYAMRNNLLDVSEEEKAQMMSQINLSFYYNALTDHDDIYLNGENIEKEIRQTQIGLNMKPIVTSPMIRQLLVQQQRALSHQGGTVADGRDVGTVIFPQAELKVFLIADVEVRTQRRYRQLLDQGYDANLDLIRQEITQRDMTDYLGEQAVNHKADDAIVIDTTDLTIEQQIAMLVSMAREKAGD